MRTTHYNSILLETLQSSRLKGVSMIHNVRLTPTPYKSKPWDVRATKGAHFITLAHELGLRALVGAGI